MEGIGRTSRRCHCQYHIPARFGTLFRQFQTQQCPVFRLFYRHAYILAHRTSIVVRQRKGKTRIIRHRLGIYRITVRRKQSSPVVRPGAGCIGRINRTGQFQLVSEIHYRYIGSTARYIIYRNRSNRRLAIYGNKNILILWQCGIGGRIIRHMYPYPV